MKTLIRLVGFPGLFESSLGAHVILWFCHAVALILLQITVRKQLSFCVRLIPSNGRKIVLMIYFSTLNSHFIYIFHLSTFGDILLDQNIYMNCNMDRNCHLAVFFFFFFLFFVLFFVKKSDQSFSCWTMQSYFLTLGFREPQFSVIYLKYFINL